MIGAKGTEYIGECAHRESIGKYGGNMVYSASSYWRYREVLRYRDIGDIERMRPFRGGIVDLQCSSSVLWRLPF